MTPTMQTATVGTFNIAPVDGILAAGDGQTAELSDLIEVNTDDTATTEVAVTKSSVVFTGDFSFATEVWLLASAAECTALDTEGNTANSEARGAGVNLMMTGDDADTTRLETVALGYALGKFLCIQVAATDDEDAVPIPETRPYVAMKTFVAGITDAAFPPGMVNHPLGYIMRDGATVRLPYLTQFSEYNQRIAIVNRGGEATYSFTFMTEDGVTATPGSDAEGTLAANSVTYLSMMFDDIVTITGSPNRAAATLIIEAEKTMIDVLVSQTNVGGGTDTVTYTDTDR